jgi:hypothetical protein
MRYVIESNFVYMSQSAVFWDQYMIADNKYLIREQEHWQYLR